MADTIGNSDARVDGLDLFLSLAELIQDLVFVWNPKGTMLWVNEAFVQRTGRTAADFEFPNPENPFIHPEDLPRVNEQLRAFLESPAQQSEPIVNRFYDAWGRAW